MWEIFFYKTVMCFYLCFLQICLYIHTFAPFSWQLHLQDLLQLSALRSISLFPWSECQTLASFGGPSCML